MFNKLRQKGGGYFQRQALRAVLGIFGTILMVAPPLMAQPDQVPILPEWLGYSRTGCELSDLPSAGNKSLTPATFPDFSICELNNFALFFDRFSEDVDFQILATKFPLKITIMIPPWDLPVYHTDEDELQEETKYLNWPQNSCTLQLFPIEKQREREHL